MTNTQAYYLYEYPLEGLYVQHFYKDKNSDIFGVSYASCGPTSGGGGWQGSGQGVVVSPQV